jgi:hypothetical protein
MRPILTSAGVGQVKSDDSSNEGLAMCAMCRHEAIVLLPWSLLDEGGFLTDLVEVASATKEEEEEEERGKSKGGGIPFLFHFAVVPACQDLLEPLPLSVNPRK